MTAAASLDLAELLGRLPETQARAALARCCGSARWVEAILAGRPWGSEAELMAAAQREWEALAADDWLEAFSHHPRIGDRRPEVAPPASRAWSRAEQAGAADSGAAVLERLHELNRRYEARFGHVFLICATGKSGEGMLAELERRLANEPAAELREAAAEQAKITRLRLEKLLAEAGESEALPRALSREP